MQLLNVMIVVMFLFALSLQSCGNRKPTISRNNQYREVDSVTEKLITTVKPLTVPMSQASLHLDLTDLARMPAGSRYTAKEGQANLEIYQAGDSIHVSATCDSLLFLVESQYREIDRLRQVIDQQNEIIEKPPSLKEKITDKITYFLFGMVLTIIIQLVWKIKKKIAL